MLRGGALLLALCLLAGSASGAETWNCPTGRNLVRNPGFETAAGAGPAEWTADPQVYALDTSVALGARSLKYANQDPARYLLCSQTIEAQAGCRYEFAAWVNTQGLTGPDSGATICLEWYDAQGKYLGGSYPDGRKGDTAWTQVRAVSTALPREAARVTLACYVRKGMTGTAWWDNVSVRRWREKPIETALLLPAYRGLLPEKATEVRVRVHARPTELPGNLEVYRLAARFSPAGETAAIVARGLPVSNDTPAEMRLPLPALSAGSYELRVTLTDTKEKRLLWEDFYPVSIGKQFPASYVDEHGRLIVNGQPFFPLGMYFSGLSEEELAVYREGAFNCLMPYGAPTRAQLDLLGGLGLKAIYSIKDLYSGTQYCPSTITRAADEEEAVRDAVRTFRDHPALLAWYINDELPSSMRDRLEAHQRWVEEEDPNHPTWAVLAQVDELPNYFHTCDILGSDPYPIPGASPDMAGQWTRLTRQAGGPARAAWMVPQAFRYPGRDRPPTYEELRSMTWQCLAEGATGLIFYSWFELRQDRQFPFEARWPEVKRVVAEVKAMVPMLLSVEKPPAIGVDQAPALHWTARAYGGAAYLILVNGERTPLTAKVHLPASPRQASLEGKAVSVSKDFRAELPPLGVSVYRLVF